MSDNNDDMQQEELLADEVKDNQTDNYTANNDHIQSQSNDLGV